MTDMTVTKTLQWFDQPGVDSLVEVSCEVPAGLPATPGAVVCAVEFACPVPEAELAGTGLFMSAKFGPFFYIEGPAGAARFSRRLRLPATPTRIGLRLWNHEEPLELTNLRIGRPNPTRRFRVNLSVDVEALPHRAASDHVDRLIYGRVGGEEHGIGAQMRLFRELGVPATFYLEFGQAALYGAEPIRAVAREILRQGFDLQLHLHAEELIRAERWPWRMKGLQPGLENLNAIETRRVMTYAVELYKEACGRAPRAFRAGSYQFNPHTLAVGSALGIAAFSNYRLDQPEGNTYYFADRRPTEPFRWSNGLYEFPVTISPEPLSALSPQAVWDRILHQVDVAGSSFVTIVIHSWSLLVRNAAGHNEEYSPRLLDSLRRLIESAPSRAEFVSMAEALDSIGTSSIGDVRRPDELVRRGVPAEAAAPAFA